MIAPALIAAACTSEATTELLRYAREGQADDTAFGDIEVVEKLAEALRIAIDLHCAARRLILHPAKLWDTDEIEELRCLRAACAGFIDGWAG